jgi:hypothetical protein
MPPPFCRQALRVFDLLRTRAVRLEVLMGKIEDTLTALGSDVMSASLEGYALLRVVGQGSGLETLRQSMGARFARRSAATKEDGSGPSAVARAMQ